MGFKEGNKLGGRQKGSLNQTTLIKRDLEKYIPGTVSVDIIKTLESMLDEIENVKKKKLGHYQLILQIIDRLTPFVLLESKLTQTVINNDNSTTKILDTFQVISEISTNKPRV
jgi:hypothetical protein